MKAGETDEQIAAITVGIRAAARSSARRRPDTVEAFRSNSLVATDLRKASTRSPSTHDRVSLTPTAGTKKPGICYCNKAFQRPERDHRGCNRPEAGCGSCRVESAKDGQRLTASVPRSPEEVRNLIGLVFEPGADRSDDRDLADVNASRRELIV